jgi:Zn-dependent protease
MTDNFSWSANAGRWMGIPVRVHLFLILFVTAIFGIELSLSSSTTQIGVGTGIVTVAIIFVSILIHELAHIFAISNLGGHVNNVVLMPWGGNSDFVVPESKQAQAAIFSAGPFVNAAIFALGATLLLQAGAADWTQLTNPFRPNQFEIGQWHVSLIKIVTWTNFQLLLVNLIPCFPFDGAPVVRSLVSAMNPDLPKMRLESAIMVMGHAVAFTLIGLAWLVRDYSPGPIQPAWLFMLLGGITLLFAARLSFHNETQVNDSAWDDLGESEYDSFYEDSPFFDFPSDHENTAYSQWLTEKQQTRLQEELRREEEEDRQADEILKKLHGDGLASLSEEERNILNRVSARLRRQRQQGVQ